MSGQHGMTDTQIREHLVYAARLLEQIQELAEETVDPDDRPRVQTVLLDDPNELELMRLTHAGVKVIAHVLRTHTCSPLCDEGLSICSALYLAWVIESCPEPDDDPDPEHDDRNDELDEEGRRDDAR